MIKKIFFFFSNHLNHIFFQCHVLFFIYCFSTHFSLQAFSACCPSRLLFPHSSTAFGPIPSPPPQAYSAPLTTPPPSAFFTFPAADNHAGAWLADKPSCWANGKVCVFPTVERKTNFSQKEKVTIKPPSHMPLTHSANTPFGRKEGIKMVSISPSPPTTTRQPPVSLFLILFCLRNVSQMYLEKPSAVCLKCVNVTPTAISGLFFVTFVFN